MIARVLCLAMTGAAALLEGCSNPTCGYVSTIADGSSGTLTYSPSGRTCGGNALTSGTFSLVGNDTDAPVGAPGVQSLGAGIVSVTSGFSLGSEGVVSFQLIATNISSGESTLGSESQLCVTNPDNACMPCMPATGTVTTTTYASTCYPDGCTLDVAGTASITASGSQGAFTLSIQLAHDDQWVSQTCSSGGDGL